MGCTTSSEEQPASPTPDRDRNPRHSGYPESSDGDFESKPQKPASKAAQPKVSQGQPPTEEEIQEEFNSIREELEQMQLLCDVNSAGDRPEGTPRRIYLGHNSHVYFAEWRSVQVCIKQVSKYPGSKHSKESSSSSQSSLSPSEIKLHFAREMSQLSNMKHPSIIEILGCNPDKGYLITPVIERGTLRDVVLGLTPRHIEGSEGAAPKKPALIWSTKYTFIQQLAAAIAYLHTNEPQYYHADLRPTHILVARDWSLHVGGFATNVRLECQQHRDEGTLNVTLRHISYLAPEAITGDTRPDTAPCDVYSFGVLAWFILTQEEPYEGLKNAQIVEKVVTKREHLPLKKFGNDVPKEINDMLLGCWAYDRNDRWSITDVKQFLSTLRH